MPGPVGNKFERIPDCSWFRGIPKSYCFTGFVAISYLLCFFMLTYGQCCHVAMTLFSALGRFKTESKNHRRTFPKHSVSVTRRRANRTILWHVALANFPFNMFSCHLASQATSCHGHVLIICGCNPRLAGGSRVPACLITSQTLIRDNFLNIVSKICNIGSKMDFNDFGV